MSRTWGNWCNPNEWSDTSTFYSYGCVNITELPSGLDGITILRCYDCFNLTFIPQISSLTDLSCQRCPFLTYIPELPNIKFIGLQGCSLLTEWKQRGENVTGMSCGDTLLLHLHPCLFIRFNGLDGLHDGDPDGAARPRNGVSSHLLSSFTVCKNLYCFEFPSRIALEVSLNAILYAPGGAKYLQLADRYKDGIQVFKNRKV